MNSSINNNYDGYWNQSAPCTEEKVAELMLENIKLLLQKKESDIEPNKGDDRKQQHQQEQQQQEALHERDDQRTRQQQQQAQSVSDDDLMRSGWEIDYETIPITYSHYARPLRDESTYPSTVEIRDAEKQDILFSSAGVMLEVRRLQADKQRKNYLDGTLLPLSRFAQERLKKEQVE